jgi:hypothetical protein
MMVVRGGLDTLCVSIRSGTLTDHPDNKMNSYSHHLRPYMWAKSSDGTLIHRFLQLLTNWSCRQAIPLPGLCEALIT